MSLQRPLARTLATVRFAMLLSVTILISRMVVTMTRLVWRRLYRVAETRFKLEG